MARLALLVVNSKSRSGKAALPEVLEGLAQRGITALHKECGSSEELAGLIASEGARCDLIIVGGGDGTLNTAAAGLIEVKRPLGILPLGTANDLARTLDIPLDLQEAIQVIADGNRRMIDIGQVNDSFFFNVASIGLSADLSRNLTADVKRRFGRLGYAIAAVKSLVRARPFRAEITSSGHRSRSLTLQVAVGNGRFYGGGNVVEKDATIVDEVLRLYSLEFVQAWRIVLMFRSFRNGEHGDLEDVLTLQSDQFEVRTRRPKPVNADGELVTRTPASFRVLPKAIEVFVP